MLIFPKSDCIASMRDLSPNQLMLSASAEACQAVLTLLPDHVTSCLFTLSLLLVNRQCTGSRREKGSSWKGG